jgi:hypothetical protein
MSACVQQHWWSQAKARDCSIGFRRYSIRWDLVSCIAQTVTGFSYRLGETPNTALAPARRTHMHGDSARRLGLRRVRGRHKEGKRNRKTLAQQRSESGIPPHSSSCLVPRSYESPASKSLPGNSIQNIGQKCSQFTRPQRVRFRHSHGGTAVCGTVTSLVIVSADKIVSCTSGNAMETDLIVDRGSPAHHAAIIGYSTLKNSKDNPSDSSVQ